MEVCMPHCITHAKVNRKWALRCFSTSNLRRASTQRHARQDAPLDRDGGDVRASWDVVGGAPVLTLIHPHVLHCGRDAEDPGETKAEEEDRGEGAYPQDDHPH